MKKKNRKLILYSKQRSSPELRDFYLHFSLIFIVILAIAMVHGYRTLMFPHETEITTPIVSIVPESKQPFSDENMTAKEESQLEQDKVTSAQMEMQINSSVRATVKPSKSFAKSRIETPVSPEHSWKLIEDLKQIPPEDAESIRRTLRLLVQQGEMAVPTIQEFLEAVEYTEFVESNNENSVNYESIELALIDTLSQIGGDQALDIMLQRLQATTEPEEIALLAKGVEMNAPGEYRDEILNSARKLMTMASEDQNQVGHNILAVAQVFAVYGDEGVVKNIEELYPKWKTFSMMVLSELPEEAGIPSLTRIVEDPEKDLNEKNYAWRMLAQASRVSPEASTAIIDAAWTNQIKPNDFIRIAETLGGKEYRLLDPELLARKTAVGMKSGNLPVTQLNLSAPRSWSDAEIDQRLDLIDRLLETKPEPTVVNALQNAKTSLLDWREIPYIDGVRKRY